MSLHIGRLTSYVELVPDAPERAATSPSTPEAEVARQRAILERIAVLEARTRAEAFDD